MMEQDGRTKGIVIGVSLPKYEKGFSEGGGKAKWMYLRMNKMMEPMELLLVYLYPNMKRAFPREEEKPFSRGNLWHQMCAYILDNRSANISVAKSTLAMDTKNVRKKGLPIGCKMKAWQQ